MKKSNTIENKKKFSVSHKVIPQKVYDIIFLLDPSERERELEQYFTELEKNIDKLQPYPKDVFLPPTIKELEFFNDILQKHGMTLDKFSAYVSRKVLDVLKNEHKKLIWGYKQIQ